MKNVFFQRKKNILYSCILGMIICMLCAANVLAKICFLPSGVCEAGEGTETDTSCTLVSPLPHYVCEKCENGRYNCFACEADYKLVNGECVCDGDDCGSMSSNGEDLRDTECSVKLNSCGLCPTGQCVCKGTKCASDYKCSKRENFCGNCEGKCICMNCCYELGDGWLETKPDGCSLEKRTLDGSKTCYKKIPCETCKDRGWQDHNHCDADKTAQAMSVVNGTQCYLCVDDEEKCTESCAELWESEDYYENKQDGADCTPVTSQKCDKTCYFCPSKPNCKFKVVAPLIIEDGTQTESYDVEWTNNKPDCKGDGELYTKEIDGCTYYYCRTWQECEDRGYVSHQDECTDSGKQAVKVAGISGFDIGEVCYECKTCSEVNSNYKDVVPGKEGLEGMPCPNKDNPQYKGMPVSAGNGNDGMKCYVCNDTRCSSKGYIEINETCPADKQNPQDIWVEEYGKNCRKCNGCPDTLPAVDSLADEFICCDECKDKDGNRRCELVEEGDVCMDSCERAGYTIKSCPLNTTPKHEKVGDKWCIVGCEPNGSGGGNSSGGKGDNGGYNTGGGDVFSDGNLCDFCCLRDTNNNIVMKSTVSGECSGVCNDNDCCSHFHTCDFRGGNSAIGIQEGTCNPQNSNFDIEGVYNCALGYECVWDGGAAPYTQGHCAPWAE